jgi:N6-adenosine-specific RNA methylase IME4
LADCPWRFGDKLPGPKRGASKHYRTMSLAEICTFDLPPIADDAWLFLWRVGAMQREALAVARAWGFSDPTSEIVWVKAARGRFQWGMGRTVRNVHEVCLVCRRGKPRRLSASVPSVVVAPRGEHSAKPDAFYAAVEKLAPGPRVELFSRLRRPGWTCYGDEVDERRKVIDMAVRRGKAPRRKAA